MPRFECPASELRPDERFCTCCKKPLSGRVAWLEKDSWQVDYFSDRGDIAAERSQGWFPFGMTCAKHKRRASGDGAATGA